MIKTNPSKLPLLSMTEINKKFAGVSVLTNANLVIEQGEVHALIGQNGAGKSTIIKILTGVYTKDSGRILFDNKLREFSSPFEAQLAGISTIYQEVNLVPYRSVAENIFLGREPKKLGFIYWRKINQDAASLLHNLGIDIDVTRPVNDYAIATQQMTAIARALATEAKLVIMDEPTSALSEHEVQTLFRVIKKLKSEGISLIFISHKLAELYEVCDRVTIMRDGQTIDVKPMNEITRIELVTKMLGRELAETLSQKHSHDSDPFMDLSPLIKVSNLKSGRKLSDVSFSIRPGEIVSLSGLLGSGRTETARAIFGADRKESGMVEINSKISNINSPRNAIREGIGFSSEDRKSEGIIPHQSVRENLTLVILPLLAKHGLVNRKKQIEVIEKFINALNIKCSSPNQPIRELSGGNQQKVLLARWLCMNPKLLILDEPTRGIDVGAKRDVQLLLRKLANDGIGVLHISSEIEEVVTNSDNVIGLRDGKSVAEFRGRNITEENLMRAMAVDENYTFNEIDGISKAQG